MNNQGYIVLFFFRRGGGGGGGGGGLLSFFLFLDNWVTTLASSQLCRECGQPS